MTNPTQEKRFCSIYITHEALDPSAISAQLGIAADKAFKKGDLHQAGDRTVAYPHGTWSVESSQHLNSDTLQDHLRFIAELVRQKAPALQQISAAGYPVRARIYWTLGDDVLSAALDPYDLAAVCAVVSGVDLSVV
jgi:hypothetical protein